MYSQVKRMVTVNTFRGKIDVSFCRFVNGEPLSFSRYGETENGLSASTKKRLNNVLSTLRNVTVSSYIGDGYTSTVIHFPEIEREVC